MALHHHVESGKEPELPLNPLAFAPDSPSVVPRFRLPEASMAPQAAARPLVRDELFLDGNARLNLATFVTTWMGPRPPS